MCGLDFVNSRKAKIPIQWTFFLWALWHIMDRLDRLSLRAFNTLNS